MQLGAKQFLKLCISMKMGLMENTIISCPFFKYILVYKIQDLKVFPSSMSAV